MLSFHLEWEDAPGVRDRVLATTWARLEIRLGRDDPQRIWPTCLLSASSKSLRTGVYGSVFPLAEWAVENWWNLFHETCRVPEFSSGRRLLSVDSSQQEWLQRHNLLTAREGGALPDLTVYRDGCHIVAHWVPDPDFPEEIRPVRFVASGEIRLGLTEAEPAFRNLIESVIERLSEMDDEDSRRLRRNWKAVCDSQANERELCQWAGNLGLDPYDPHQLTDELVDLLTAGVPRLDAPLAGDLLEASRGNRIDRDLEWVEQARQHVESVATPSSSAANGEPGLQTAHETGYSVARQFRSRFDLPSDPARNLVALLRQNLGWPQEYEVELANDVQSPLIGLTGRSSAGFPKIVGPRLTGHAQSFRLARALYFLSEPETSIAARIVTKSFGWDQRASRAFAAELLAPADALREEVSGTASFEDIARLAEKFHVDTTLIGHQVRNHRIAWMSEI
jgi:hypothetical protein